MLGESNHGSNVFYVSKTILIRRHDIGQCVKCNQIDFVTGRRFQFFRDCGPISGHIHVHNHGDSRILGYDRQCPTNATTHSNVQGRAKERGTQIQCIYNRRVLC